MTGLFIKFAYYSNQDCWINPNLFSIGSVSQPKTSLFTSATTNTSTTKPSAATTMLQVANDGDFQFSRKYKDETYVGKRFDKKWDKYLAQLDLLDAKPTDEKKILHSRPVIISAFSNNHYGEARTMIKYIEELYNYTKILYIYDLGMK